MEQTRQILAAAWQSSVLSTVDRSRQKKEEVDALWWNMEAKVSASHHKIEFVYAEIYTYIVDKQWVGIP